MTTWEARSHRFGMEGMEAPAFADPANNSIPSPPCQCPQCCCLSCWHHVLTVPVGQRQSAHADVPSHTGLPHGLLAAR